MKIEEFATLYTKENAPNLSKHHKIKNLPLNFFETITETDAICVEIDWEKLGYKAADTAYNSLKQIILKWNFSWIPHRYRNKIYLIRKGSEIDG